MFLTDLEATVPIKEQKSFPAPAGDYQSNIETNERMEMEMIEMKKWLGMGIGEAVKGIIDSGRSPVMEEMQAKW